MTSAANPNVDVEGLRHKVTGQVISPDDAGYDDAKELFIPAFDSTRPAAIVQVADAADVATAIAAAHQTGLQLAVRGGGHSAAGHSTTEGGIVIDLRALKALEIDLESNAAWAESGLTAAEYSNETNAQGLITGLGDTGSVGLGGITLGGGIGFLVRKHGMTIDSLLAAEVVTADGELIHTDQLRVLGGAMARVPNEATAFSHRDRKMMVNVASFYEGPDDRPRREQWVSDFAKTLRDGDLGGYVGFLADEGEDRVRAAYPGPTWDRLRQVKAKYDPDNLFRLNQNIPPAATPT